MWLPLIDPSAQHQATREQNTSVAKFAGGEGVVKQHGVTWFSTKRENRIWQYDAASGELAVIYDVANSRNPILTGVDNIKFTPAGDLFVAEDGGDMQIVVLRPSASSSQFDVVPRLQVVGHDRSEICGPAFDLQFSRLYFSSQRGMEGVSEDGYIFEINRRITDSLIA